MNYAYRRASASESGRWIVHKEGRPYAVCARTLTRWGARHLARRWARLDARAERSYTP